MLPIKPVALLYDISYVTLLSLPFRSVVPDMRLVLLVEHRTNIMGGKMAQDVISLSFGSRHSLLRRKCLIPEEPPSCSGLPFPVYRYITKETEAQPRKTCGTL